MFDMILAKHSMVIKEEFSPDIHSLPPKILPFRSNTTKKNPGTEQFSKCIKISMEIRIAKFWEAMKECDIWT